MMALVVAFFCCRSHRTFFLSDSVISVASIFRRVVLGEKAICCVLRAFMTIGFDLVICPGSRASEGFSIGEPPSEGPLDIDVLVLLITGEDFEAKLAKVAARSSSCNPLVKMDRRETRSKFVCESTRWNKGLSLAGFSALSDASSSQSSSSSSSSSESSSIALSSSSSDSNTSSSSWDLFSRARDSTSSRKDSVFLFPLGRFRPKVSELCLGREAILSSKELSSSPEEPPPSMKTASLLIAFSVLAVGLYFTGIASGARCVFER